MEMTDEMIEIARELFDLAGRYAELYCEVNSFQPVIWLKHNESEEYIFLTDRCRGEFIEKIIK